MTVNMKVAELLQKLQALPQDAYAISSLVGNTYACLWRLGRSAFEGAWSEERRVT